MLRCVLLLVAFIGSANAANFTVTNLADTGAGSLRDAVGQANATPEADTITFNVTGTIVLTNGQISITAPLTISGPGAANLTIDGNASNRIFGITDVAQAVCPAPTVPTDFLVTISGLTLRNAQRLTDNTGGAIHSFHSLALDGMIIRDNAAKAGAGLSFLTQYPNQTLTVTNSQFLDNLAKPLSTPATGTIAGGAIRIAENCAGARTQPVTVSIANSLFQGNRAQPTTQSARGAGIVSFSYADITITDSRLIGNVIDTPTPFVASYNGGGFWGTAKSIAFHRSEIANNFADVAGAIGFYNDISDLQTVALATDVSIVNTTISNNSTTTSNIFAFGNVALDIHNSTIAGNVAAPTRTGGIGFNTGPTVPPSASNALPPSLNLVSTIVWNPGTSQLDFAKNNTNIPGPYVVSASNSMIGTICGSACGTITISGAANQIGVDPQVESLQFNGGPTRTRALALGSPAIGAGANPLGLATDQRGNGYPRTQGALTDVGAYEYVYPAECAGFTDVPGSSGFCANVAWLKNHSVTLGCTSATLYCPGDVVSRLAMAAFMNRLGTALSPATVDAEAVTSPLDLAPVPTVCQTTDIPSSNYPRRATLDAVFAGLAPSDTFVRSTFRVSTDAGTTWTNLASYRALVTLEAAQWRNMRSVGQFDLPAGQSVRFGLRMDRGDGAVGPTMINESTCHLRVRLENSSGFSLP